MKHKLTIIGTILIFIILFIFFIKPKEKKLYRIVEVGDYVNYDAGIWDDGDEKLYFKSNFSGIIAQYDKNESTAINCYHTFKSEKSGWQVLKAEGKNVYLIHAGTPACYSIERNSDISTEESLRRLDKFIQDEFVDEEYAESARNLKCSDIFENETCQSLENLKEKQIKLLDNKGYYWLTSKRNDIDLIYYWSAYEMYFKDGYDHIFGIRPIVVLKDNVLWNGVGTGQTLNQAYGIKIKNS